MAKKKTETVIAEHLNRPLVGQWFHSFQPKNEAEKSKRREFKWQGQVVADLGNGYFAVELRSWFDGCVPISHGRVIVHLSRMAGEEYWSFYETNEQMNDAYEHWHP